MNAAITIRHTTPRDTRALLQLAALDDRPQIQGDALLAFVDGELAAARPLERGQALADPFRRTAHLLDMLELWATQERAA